LIWFEATAVVEEGRSNPRQFYLHEANVGEFERLVAETRRAASESPGPDQNSLLILQLTHSGRWSKPDGTRRPLIAHHNHMLDAMVDIDASYPLANDGELDRLQDAFVDAARLAASAGFDGIDVKSCHGYLGSELLAAYTRSRRCSGPDPKYLVSSRPLESMSSMVCRIPMVSASRVTIRTSPT
jgi:2,4-dienoyl-CoA reductase-like NADH-dependent reductase (Old Yellow Enzyme family)